MSKSLAQLSANPLLQRFRESRAPGRRPVVTAPISGPRTIAQLDGSMRALEIHLSEETPKRLDVIWPGPGGPAPEDYAW